MSFVVGEIDSWNGVARYSHDMTASAATWDLPSGSSSLLLEVTPADETDACRLRVRGRLGTTGELRLLPVVEATTGRSLLPDQATTRQETRYWVDVTGITRVEISRTSTATRSTIRGVASAAATPEPLAHGARWGSYSSAAGSSSGSIACWSDTRLLVEVTAIDPEVAAAVLRIDGVAGTDGTTVRQPVYTDGGLELDRIPGPGRYWVDVQGLSEVTINRAAGSQTNAQVRWTLVSTPGRTPQPTATWGGHGFVRLDPAVGEVNGMFYALKALTDCTLSSRIQFAAIMGVSTTSQSAGLANTDPLPAGDILYGPFVRLAVTSGVALAYRI